MANGDITAVKVLYRQSLGGGQDENGVKKNSKTLVVGEITCTYVSTGVACNKAGGVSVFGLKNVDFVKILPYIIAAAYPTANALFKGDYDVTNQKIFLLEDCGAADPAPPSDADACRLRFIAIGDDADAPELT